MTARKASVDSRSSEFVLKSRVKDLEGQVSKLKTRLDELRKAKNSTVIKHEKEFCQVGLPFSERRRKSDFAQRKPSSSDDVTDLRKTHADEIAKMEHQYEDKLKKLQVEVNKDCDHEERIQKLLFQLSQQETEMASITAENEALKQRIDELLSELSVKEAEWCNKEEQYKMQLRQMKPWEEEYQLWMRMMEAKLSDAQQAQTFLRTVIRKDSKTLEERGPPAVDDDDGGAGGGTGASKGGALSEGIN